MTVYATRAGRKGQCQEWLALRLWTIIDRLPIPWSVSDRLTDYIFDALLDRVSPR